MHVGGRLEARQHTQHACAQLLLFRQQPAGIHSLVGTGRVLFACNVTARPWLFLLGLFCCRHLHRREEWPAERVQDAATQEEGVESFIRASNHELWFTFAP